MREQIHPDLLRISVPMRGHPPAVNAYLLRGSKSWILIDTGMPYADEFLQEDLELIVITHLHPDHSGRAAELRLRTGAPVWMHPDDTRLLAELKHSNSHDLLLRHYLQQAGTPAEMAEAVLASSARLFHLFPDLQPDAPLLEGLRFPSALGPVQVIYTPGHSPGHCCLWLEQPGWLISGDHILESTTPHVGILPGRDALADYASTLDRLRALPASLVLPGHGNPFPGLAPAIDRIRRHQSQRAARLRALLDEKPRSTHELITSLFSRIHRPSDYHFALTALLAHLPPPQIG